MKTIFAGSRNEWREAVIWARRLGTRFPCTVIYIYHNCLSVVTRCASCGRERNKDAPGICDRDGEAEPLKRESRGHLGCCAALDSHFS